VHSRFCTKEIEICTEEIATRSTPMRTLPGNSGRRRSRCVSVRRHSVRCRRYLHADAPTACAARKFGTCAGKLGALPENSGRGRDNWVPCQENSVRRQENWVRCQAIRDVGGIIGCPARRFGTSAGKLGALPEKPGALAEEFGALPENSGRRRRRSVPGRFRSVCCRKILLGARPLEDRPPSVVACVFGQSECSQKWTASLAGGDG
jgi:hypothetical protein